MPTLAPNPAALDLPAFWQEESLCQNKPFSTDKPRCPIGLPVDDHWLLDEMKVPSTVLYYHDAAYRAAVNRECNDRCEAIIGRRPFGEHIQPTPPLRIEEVFGCTREVIEGGTPWLEPTVHTIDDMHRKLDQLEALDDPSLRGLIFSNGGRVDRAKPNADGGKPVTGVGSRGPATIGTSVLGTTQLMFYLMDNPDDMDRFYNTLADILIRYQRILAAERGVTIRGYAILDDNCALFSPDLYRRFCLPVLEKLHAAFAPEPDDWRFQHSDSEMSHLLPLLATRDMTAVNLGPTIDVRLIRRHMPRTEIRGQIAPNTLRNDGFDAIVGEVQRDFQRVGADGGLLITTAGSISAGTKLESIRELMWAVQTCTRYDN